MDPIFRFSQRVTTLQESSTIMMSRLSREKAAQGHAVINLSLGEPDFNTPDHIKAAAKQAIDEGYTHYPPVSGYPDLKAAIIEKYWREHNVKSRPEQILISTGAKQSLSNLFEVLLRPGDLVIVPTPYWVSYHDMIRLTGAQFIPLPAGPDTDYKITPEQLQRALTPTTRMVILNSPNNPTGVVYNHDELADIVEVLRQAPHVFIISDEIYDWLTFDGQLRSLIRFEDIRSRLAIVNGVSKSYAMTGWRIGYFIAPEPITQQAEKLQGQITSGACSISQRAAIAALTGDHSPTIAMRRAFQRRCNAAIQILQQIPHIQYAVPQGAMYIFLDIRHYLQRPPINSDLQFALWFLKQYNVSVVPGQAFGMPGHIRISFSVNVPQLQEALQRLGEALQNLTT